MGASFELKDNGKISVSNVFQIPSAVNYSIKSLIEIKTKPPPSRNKQCSFIRLNMIRGHPCAQNQNESLLVEDTPQTRTPDLLMSPSRM